MKIRRIHINHFGKLENQTISFSQGIHVISGENESGKSTLHAFLQAMLFGIERSRGRGARTDAYSRYLPWNGSNTYGGVMELEKDGVCYSIHRNFEKNVQPCTLVDETHAKELTPSGANFSELFSGLTPALYANTLSVGQLRAATGPELADELRNHIVNLRSAGSSSVDISQALLSLKKEKKKQESAFSREADHENVELGKRIHILEEELKTMPAGKEIPSLEHKKDTLDREILRLGAHHQQLTNIISRGEESLKNHQIAQEADVEETLEQVRELEEDRQKFLSHYRKPLTGALRPLAAALGLILAAGALAGLWFSCTLVLSRHYLPAIGVFLGSIVSGTLAVRLGRRREASSDYRENCRMMREIYEYHFGENPDVPDEELASLLEERLNHCRNLYQTIAQSHQTLRQDMDALLKAQQKQPAILAQLEQARRQQWLMEQKEEALRSLQNHRDAIQEAVQMNRRVEEEIAAITLAMETMQELSSTVFDSFGFFLEEKASELVKGLTDGAYAGLAIDEDLSLSLIQDGKRIPLYQASTGTIEQVYLAFRLACVEFLWPDEQMPLFLDDSFAYYDSERLSATLRWLSENYSGQIFLFTCHQREEEILSAAKIPYHRIPLS
ncbi:AAA family ATPase [Cuneatibacter sp. NSJ-177]|uniref:ATP-binding protein n=1 Tax=Cuneatibacter sp. NSJ-177 TaxID=2931401 RepID=UPI001FD43783|nr:AAA family ATPase [Cuneatibacter sp. NSJ-177]MCJ7834657.1 AAA family ATPase [Cuneatibacter sp. NSJ-177]